MSAGRVVRRTLAHAGLAVVVVVGTIAVAPALAAASTTSTSASTWSSVAALPALAGVSSISCPSTTTCVAVGVNSNDYGGVEATTDGGATWSAGSLPSPVVGGPTSVSCPTTSWCMAVGGRTFVSADGGATWSSTAFPTALVPLAAVACTSVDVCVVAGANASGDTAVVTTSDGGSTWSTASVPAGPLEGTALACSSASNCDLVATIAGSSEILGSTDGGATWSVVESSSLFSDDITAISCPSTTTCLAVGNSILSASLDAPVAFATSDGGASWSSVPFPASVTHAELTGVACSAATTCTVVGSGSASTQFSNAYTVALTTTDGGASWQQGTLPATSPLPRALACPSSTTCVAAGIAGAAEDALVTDDGGATWSSTTLATGDSALDVVSCPTTSACFAAGSTPVPEVVASSDGGSTWSAPTPVPGLVAINGMACSSTTVCVTVGQSASGVPAAYTTDGGTSWASAASSTGADDLESVVCLASATCVAVGATTSAGTSGVGLVSVDSGASWTKATVPSGTPGLGGVSCPSSSVCYATYSGSTPGVLRSSDGGTTWSALTVPSGTGVTGPISCPTASACYVLLGNGDVMVTNDSGTTWTEVSEPIVAPTSITCLTALVCAAVGMGPAGIGMVATTVDGASTWSSAPGVPSASTFGDISCPSITACVAVGYGSGPTSTLVGAGPLAPGVVVTTTSLPEGEIGVSYYATLAATSGAAPYTWSIPSGGLPRGLSLDTATGVITGSPTTAGTFSLSVEATDQADTTDTVPLTLTVLPVEPPPTTAVGLPASGTTLSNGVWLDASAESSAGVRSVTFILSGGSLAQPEVIATATPTSVGWLGTWDTTSVPDGAYTLESFATDVVGLTGTSAPVTVTVDNSPLHTAVLVPSSGAVVGSSGQVVLDASAAGESQVTSVTFQASGGSLAAPATVGTATLTVDGWIAIWDVTSATYPAGTYSVVSVAADANGNTATSTPVSITLAPPAG